MENIKLVYFKSCPEAKHARAALLTSGIGSFQVILQDELPEGHFLKSYSSPTILKGEEVIYGKKLDEGASACSYQKIDPATIQSKLKGDDNPEKGVKKTGGFLSAAGSLGSGLAVGLCPLCIPAIGAFLASIGLGFMVQESVLKPALVLMLLATNAGFFWSYLKKHGNILPFIFGALASVAMYIGRYVYLSSNLNFLLMYGSIPALIGIAIWNLYLNKKGKKGLACGACVAEAAKI